MDIILLKDYKEAHLLIQKLRVNLMGEIHHRQRNNLDITDVVDFHTSLKEPMERYRDLWMKDIEASRNNTDTDGET